mgnify:CR=1 FL=1
MSWVRELNASVFTIALVAMIAMRWDYAPRGQVPASASCAAPREDTAGLDGTSLYFGPKVQKNYISADHLLFEKPSYEFAIVADLDLESRLPEEFTWHSFLMKGKLRRVGSKFSVSFEDPTPLYVPPTDPYCAPVVEIKSMSVAVTCGDCMLCPL